MNQVETSHTKEALLLRNDFGFLNDTSTNDSLTSTFTEPAVATDSPSTTMNPNLTIIGTILKTGVAIQDLTSQHEFDHSFYIYIWAASILGCILFTTGRYAFICFFYFKI